MIQSNSGSNLIRDYLKVLFRHRGKLVAWNLLILALAVAVILVWPREYKSEAKVWIKIGRENSKLDPTAATGKTISIQESDREDEIKSVIDVIGSRGVIEAAVEQLGPEVVLGDKPLPNAPDGPEPSPVTLAIKRAVGSVVDLVKSIDPVDDHEEAVQEIIKHMEVDAERKSNVVSVTYDTTSPALAQAVVAAVIEEYKKEHTRIHKTEGSHSFFGKQLQTLKDRVEEASQALRESKDEVGLATIKGHMKFLENQMEDVGTARLEAQRKLAESQALIAELEKQLAAHPQQIKSEERSIPNTGRDMIRSQLYDLQVERMELESKMKNHPRLEAIKKQEAEARRELAGKTTTSRSESSMALNDVHQELALRLARTKSSAAGFKATLDALKQQQKQVLAEISSLNEAEIDIRQKERNVQLATKSYMSYAEKFEDARMDDELNQSAISNVSVAQAPTLELKPVSPSKLVVAVLSLAAMLFGSLAILGAMLLMDDSVHDRDDLASVVQGPITLTVPNQRQFRHVVN